MIWVILSYKWNRVKVDLQNFHFSYYSHLRKKKKLILWKNKRKINFLNAQYIKIAKMWLDSKIFFSSLQAQRKNIVHSCGKKKMCFSFYMVIQNRKKEKPWMLKLIMHPWEKQMHGNLEFVSGGYRHEFQNGVLISIHAILQSSR